MLQFYSHILTLRFKHRYFIDELFKSVEITNDEETNKLIKDLDLIIKPFPGGFNLLTSQPELLRTASNVSPLRFYIHSKDPEYINYTELPNHKLTDRLLYFNNLSVNQSANNNSLLLHPGEFVGVSEIIPVSQSYITIPQFDSAKRYRFSDASGNEISAPNIMQVKPDGNVFSISNLPQGLIRYYKDSTELGKVYYYPTPIWKKPLAILEVFTDNLLTQFQKNGTVEYAVNFNNRKTTWKYFLISPIYQNFNRLSIINKGKEQVFNGPQKQQVQLNPNVLVFESKNEIPLSEFSDENFQLVDNFNLETHSGKIILKNLDKASPAQLFVDELQPGEKTYSHIYI